MYKIPVYKTFTTCMFTFFLISSLVQLFTVWISVHTDDQVSYLWLNNRYRRGLAKFTLLVGQSLGHLAAVTEYIIT